MGKLKSIVVIMGFMDIKSQAKNVAELLSKAYPNAHSELNYSNEMEFAIAVMLSAQTTDKKVNEITKQLFSKYKSWEDFASADLDTLRSDIRGVNFHLGKAERIIRAAQIVLTEFSGDLPRKLSQLITIPGIARKSANVILNDLWGITEGIVVDTHVTRVSSRLGLTKEKNPVKIEKDLMNLVPRKYWGNISNSMVLHGRYVCIARKPKCGECVLRDLCPSRLV